MICENKSTSSDNLYETIKSLLWEARAKSNFSTNFYTVQAYWNLGRMIVLEQKVTRMLALPLVVVLCISYF